MKSLPVGPFSGFTAGLCKVDAEPPGDKNEACPLTIGNRLRFWSGIYAHDTSITSVDSAVNTSITSV